MIGGDDRVLRGGSWNNNGRNARSANRNRNEPANRNNNIGFRLALARTIVDTPFDQIVIQSAVVWRQKENALRRVSRAGLESPSKRRLIICLSFYISSTGKSNIKVDFLVSTRLRGNAVSGAPAPHGALVRPGMHSHAGAWEQD